MSILDCLLIVAFALVVLIVSGYFAACAGAQRWINFIDWLLLRLHK